MNSDTPSSATITRTSRDGLTVVTLDRGATRELSVTAIPNGGNLHTMFENVLGAVQDAGAAILCKDVFGIPAVEQARIEAPHEVWGRIDWPVTWLDEGGSAGAKLTGVHARAVAGAAVRRIRLDGRVVGSAFDDGKTRHCYLGDLRPKDGSTDRRRQARETFDTMIAALASEGLDFSRVARTWFYLDDILSWYGPFNEVRNALFEEMGVFGRVVPASTGVGGANAAGAALVADAYAAASPGDAVSIIAVPSPLQGSALDYKSAFSRAVEVDFRDHRRLLISGTASIAPDGKTVHLGDVPKQIDLTMRVAGAILQSRGMDWSDVSRSILYVKHGRDAGCVRRYLREHDLLDMPAIITENDICRDDLLFEIELDAWAAHGPKTA